MISDIETVKWNFSCGCGKVASVRVPKQPHSPESAHDAAADIVRSRDGWVTVPGESMSLSCSSTCWNRYHEALFAKRVTFYPQWWEWSPYGRAKHDCDVPPCNCPPRYHEVFTFDGRGRGRTVRLLDSFHHDEGCWWGIPPSAVNRPRPVCAT